MWFKAISFLGFMFFCSVSSASPLSFAKNAFNQWKTNNQLKGQLKNAPLATKIEMVKSAPDIKTAMFIASQIPELKKFAGAHGPLLPLLSLEKKNGTQNAMVNWALGNNRRTPLSTKTILGINAGGGFAVQIDTKFLSAGSNDDYFSSEKESVVTPVPNGLFRTAQSLSSQLQKVLPGVTPKMLGDTIEANLRNAR